MLKHCAIKRHGAVKATLHAFLTSMRDRSQYPAFFSDNITRCTRCREGGASTDGLEVGEEEKSHALVQNRSPVILRTVTGSRATN